MAVAEGEVVVIKRLALLGVLAAVTIQPPWIVVRWETGDCKIWNNDGAAPLGVYRPVAYAQSYGEAFAKMQVLYSRRVCI
jgi:hypothetical protein